MGPTSKEAVLAALGHIVDELLQQRETGRQILIDVRKLARAQDVQREDHSALERKVSEIPRVANGKGH
jgi:hypothetical protein